MTNNLNHLRKEYKKAFLEPSSMHNDPQVQFEGWLDEALKAGIEEPNAMTLATCGSNGMPSVRMVLLKGIEQGGFVFYTNYNSRKGKHLHENPNAALLFFWPVLERQVRIEGTVKKTSKDLSDQYFYSRPYESQVGALVSEQSKVIGSRNQIERPFKELMINPVKQLSRPANWGGYVLRPNLFEFWQGREHRLHDRIQYTFTGSGWEKERLSP